jgi:phosphopantothenoylcysteine decarboxylase/phosphopantothenate--cysteine ligase
VREQFSWCEVLIMTAAVADWRPAEPIAGKLKKHDGERRLRLVRTPDILRTVSPGKGERYLVGFAAESENLEENAAAKLREKNLDLIVANHVMQADAAFAADTNRVVMLLRDGRRTALPLLSKKEVAHRILEQVEADIVAAKS